MWEDEQENQEETDETPSPGLVYERDLGSADDGKEEEAEKILETITSLNDEKTSEGLDLLLPEKEEEEKKDNDDKDDSSITKKIV